MKLTGNFLELNNSADVQLTLNKANTQLFSIRNNSTAGVHINTQNSAILAFGVSTGSNNGTVESDLRINASGNVQIPADNKKLQIGAGQDLELYHDGSNSFIKDAGTGILNISSNLLQIINAAGNEVLGEFNENGSAELYYDNSKKLATQSVGVDVTGGVYATGTITAGVNIKAKYRHW